MAYTLSDKGLAKWMIDNLPETLFSEYYKIYQNDIKTSLIQSQKIWYGDGIEEITLAMLKELKEKMSEETSIRTILMVSVISNIEIFLNRCSQDLKDEIYSEKSEIPGMPISNVKKKELQTDSVIYDNKKPLEENFYPDQKQSYEETSKFVKKEKQKTNNYDSVNKDRRLSIGLKFYDYLNNELKLADSSCKSYISAIRSAERFAREHKYSSTSLLTENLAEAEKTLMELDKDLKFQAFDKSKNYRFSKIISKLMNFYHTGEISKQKFKIPTDTENKSSISFLSTDDLNQEEHAILNKSHHENKIDMDHKLADSSVRWNIHEDDLLQEELLCAKQLIKCGFPEPLFGFELIGSKGDIIGECMMAWKEKKIAVMMPWQQEENRAVFEKCGWKVFVYCETDENWYKEMEREM